MSLRRINGIIKVNLDSLGFDPLVFNKHILECRSCFMLILNLHLEN